MKNASLQICIITFITFFFSIPAFSQTTYSLTQLISKAEELSETIKIAEDDLEIALQEKQRALSVLIPKFSTYGAVTEYKDDDMAMPDTATVGIKVTQSFTLNGKELIAFQVTKKDIEAKEYSLESIRAQYLLQVAQSFYNILSARKYVEIAQSDVERLTAHKNAVTEKLSVGNVTKTDLYRAQAELSKSKTELVKAQNGVLAAKAVLMNLVDIEPDFELEKTVQTGIENYDTSLQEIEAFALDNRPEIKQAQANLDIARKTVKFNKSDYWPSISLEAGYKETKIKYDFVPSEVKYDTEDAYITGQLVFTLYDGGLRKAQIRQAAAGQRKAGYALTLEKKKIILDSKTAFLDYMTAKSTLFNLEDELKSAEENYNAVQMQFKYGMADSIDIMDANTLLVTAQRRISDARYTYYLSVLKILYTRGDLVPFLMAGQMQ